MKLGSAIRTSVDNCIASSAANRKPAMLLTPSPTIVSLLSELWGLEVHNANSTGTDLHSPEHM